VGVVLVFAGGCTFFYRVGGRKNVAGLAELKRRVSALEKVVWREAVDRRERPAVSHADPKRLHDRLTTNEQICREAMSRLEAAVDLWSGPKFFFFVIVSLSFFWLPFFVSFGYHISAWGLE
jgi:hypothetical protein